MSLSEADLPSTWAVATFEDCIEIQSDYGRRVDQRDYSPEGQLPVIDQGGGLIGGYTNDPRKRYQGPLPVIVFGDHTRRIKYIDFDFAVGAQGVKLLKPLGCWMPKYLAYLLEASPIPNRGYSRHFQFLRKLRLPVPPLPEQHRIVIELEKHLSLLSSGSKTLARAQANLQRYRAAVLKAACEGRLVPTEAELAGRAVREYETGEQLVKRILNGAESAACASGHSPELPNGWTTITVGVLAKVGTGATPLRSRREYYVGGTIPWVTSSALNEDHVSLAGEFVTEKALNECNLTVYPPGTLLLAMYGEGKTRGKCSELKIAACTNQAIAALVTDGPAAECRPYLKIFLQENYHDIRRLSAGGVQPNLNLSLVRNLTLPIPPLAEQRRIVCEVSRIFSLVDELETIVEHNLKRVDALRTSILRSAFCGELVPPIPGDEPASVLLERIRQERASAADGHPRRRGRRPASMGKRARQGLPLDPIEPLD